MADLQSLWSLSRPGIRITEAATMLSMLRVLRDDTAAAERLGIAFGLAWPEGPGALTGGPVRTAWTAPGQWVVFEKASNLAGTVASACAEALYHLTDLSAARRLWRLEGRQARALLAKGCSLDAHPDLMPPGSCVSTLLGQVPALLVTPSTGDAFDIIADVSFAGHVQAWFVEATQEFVDDRSPIRPSHPVA